jgi:DNA replication protein DnaD
MRSFKKYSGKEGKSASELTKALASAWSGKSSGAMLKEILQEAEKSKRAGTLSNEEIDAFYTQFAPMLSPLERKKLQMVVKKLKEIE